MVSTLHDILPTDALSGVPADLGGLLGLARDGERPFPLRGVKVRAHIAGDCCRTVVEQSFANPYDVALEAVHIFPLPDDGAVIEVELRAGPVIVRGECRERQHAEDVFRQARDAGRRAALLTQERANVHTLRVTNIPAKTDVTVRLVIVQHLESADGRLCWRFPTVVAPRYTPGEPISHEGDGVVPDTDRVPDASRLQPPLRLKGGTLLDLEVALAGPIRLLESSQHAVRTEFGERVRVAPAAKATLDRDFVLWFAAGLAEQPTARAFTDGQHTLVTVDPPLDVTADVLPRDAVFVIDISGSMGGAKIEAAKRALSTALHGLAAGDQFQLIAFDNTLEVFRPALCEYTEATLSEADAWIGQLNARGGTEMLPALQAALAGRTPAGRARTILFITDGQATNDAELLAALEQRRGDARLFTVGIDTAVNGNLLKRLARAGGGTCELLTPQQDIEAAIAKLESRFGAPLVTELRIDGAEAARPGGLAVFAGRPASFLIAGTFEQIHVRGKTAQGSTKFTVAPAALDFPLGPLWARERVAWLEDELAVNPEKEAKLRPEILRVALQYGIASRYTAFVAVEAVQSTDGTERVVVVQPVELPEEWSSDFLSAAPSHMSFCLSPLNMLGTALRDLVTPAAQHKRKRGFPVSHDLLQHLSCSENPADSPISPLAPASDEQAKSARRRSTMGKSGAPDAGSADGISSILARTQQADGSYGGDIGRTAAALVALVVLGNTRRAGIRRRVVVKAANWLLKHTAEPLARLALDVLEQAEVAKSRPTAAQVTELFRVGLEGQYLREACSQAEA